MSSSHCFDVEKYRLHMRNPSPLILSETPGSLQRRISQVDVDLGDVEIHTDYTGFRANGLPCLAITTMIPVLRTAVIVALAVSYSGSRAGVEWITRVGYDNTGFGSHMYWPGVQLQPIEGDPALRPDWLFPQSGSRSTRSPQTDPPGDHTR